MKIDRYRFKNKLPWISGFLGQTGWTEAYRLVGTSDNCVQQCLCQNSSFVRIPCHIPVFATITVFLGGRGEWVGRCTKINYYIRLLNKGVCKPTYMPCLSTCRSHSEPSVNSQNSHGSASHELHCQDTSWTLGENKIIYTFMSIRARRDIYDYTLIFLAALQREKISWRKDFSL